VLGRTALFAAGYDLGRKVFTENQMNESEGPQGAEKSEEKDLASAAPLRFMGQYIKDLSFEVPNAPDIFNLLQQKAPEIPITIDANAEHINAGVFETTLSVALKAEVEGKTAFILELLYGCLVEVNPKAIAEEHIHPLLNIEVPRHMFPFVRQIISDLTANGGFPPLLMQIVDFRELYRKKMAALGRPIESGAAPEPASPTENTKA
jgi:preprotein translocase subunit SecB